MVIPYRRFRTTCRPKRPIGCLQTSARNYRYSLRNNPEGRSSQGTLRLYRFLYGPINMRYFIGNHNDIWKGMHGQAYSFPSSLIRQYTFNLRLKIWYRTSVAQPTVEDAEQLTKGRLQTRHVASVATGISIHMKRERRNVFPRRTLAQRFQKMSHKRIRHTYRHLSVF